MRGDSRLLVSCEEYWIIDYQNIGQSNQTGWWGVIKKGSTKHRFTSDYVKHIFYGSSTISIDEDLTEIPLLTLSQYMKSKIPLIITAKHPLFTNQSHVVVIVGKINTGQYTDHVLVLDSNYSLPIIVHPATLKIIYIGMAARMVPDCIPEEYNKYY